MQRWQRRRRHERKIVSCNLKSIIANICYIVKTDIQRLYIKPTVRTLYIRNYNRWQKLKRNWYESILNFRSCTVIRVLITPCPSNVRGATELTTMEEGQEPEHRTVKPITVNISSSIHPTTLLVKHNHLTERNKQNGKAQLRRNG